MGVERVGKKPLPTEENARRQHQPAVNKFATCAGHFIDHLREGNGEDVLYTLCMIRDDCKQPSSATSLSFAHYNRYPVRSGEGHTLALSEEDERPHARQFYLSCGDRGRLMVVDIRADTLQAMNSYLCHHVQRHTVITMKVKIRVGAPAYLADKGLRSRTPALLCNSGRSHSFDGNTREARWAPAVRVSPDPGQLCIIIPRNGKRSRLV